MLAPPDDAVVAELADRQAAPLDFDAVVAPARADRPVGEHEVTVDREVRARRTTPASPMRTLLRAASGTRRRRRRLGPPGIVSAMSVVPAVDVRVDIGRQPRSDASREHRARVVDGEAHDERSTNPSTSVREPVAHLGVEVGGAGQRLVRLRRMRARATAIDASITSGSATSATTFSTSGHSSLRPSRSRSSRRRFERIDHGQRVHALVHVVAGGLAELGHGAA